MTQPSKLPWRFCAKLSGSENHRGFRVDDHSGYFVADVSPRDEDGLQGKVNATLIVEAVNSHAALVERVAKLEGALEAVLPYVQCGEANVVRAALAKP